jgi:hypothetical protein
MYHKIRYTLLQFTSQNKVLLIIFLLDSKLRFILYQPLYAALFCDFSITFGFTWRLLYGNVTDVNKICPSKLIHA